MDLVRSRWTIAASLLFIALGFTKACNNTLTGSKGVIESPNFPDSYPHNHKCSWTIAVPKGNIISITFSYFSLERSGTCGSDYVEVLEVSKYGEHIKLGSFCGKSVPKTFEVASNVAIVRFVTDQSLTDGGFKLEWTTKGYVSEEVFEKNIRDLFRNGPCYYNQYRCLNDACVSRRQLCDGRNDCGDHSDEQYCRVQSCPFPLTSCYSYSYQNDKCIPFSWICDGHADCFNGTEDIECDIDDNSFTIARLTIIKQKAVEWIFQGRSSESLNSKWGTEVARKAVALYLGDQDSFLQNTTIMSEMAYEVSLSLLSRTTSRRLKGVSSTALATYLNAFLVTCVNPRRFYGMDLVSELRERADASNDTHPSVILALCNAGEHIVDKDIKKMNASFWAAHRNYRTDKEALAVLALSCAADQNQDLLDDVDLSELTSELKNKQYRNGTVETLQTTALVMQALYASESEPDEDNFDEEKALLHILKSQMSDGSFGNTINTYYVLPVLAYKSLVNVSSSHCSPRITDEQGSLQDLLNLVGQKSSVRFSLWIGDNRTLQRTVTLKVPSNTSFYEVMEWAARVDTQYRFEYSMRDRKPYIYSISGIQDDPENNLFWFLHSIDSAGDEKPTLIKKSPADVFPKNGKHLAFWYKSG